MIARFLTAGSIFILTAVLPLYGQSSQSVLLFDPSFVYSTRIQYLDMQATDINNGVLSQELARYKLQDGNGSSNDPDGLATTITDITFAVTINGGAGPVIRRLALYIGTTEVQEVPGNASTNVTFSGISISALDDFWTSFSLKATFYSSVSDNDLIEVRIVSVTLSAGSQFNPTGSVTGGNISGNTVTGATPTPNNVNKIDVIATKLDFTTAPQPYAGINEPFAGGVVEAHDPFGNRDTEFNAPASVLAPAAVVTGSFTFSGGVLSLANLVYASAGDGTLTVVANGLTSIMNGVISGYPNVSIPSPHVGVIHVATTLATGGVPLGTHLFGGALNSVIFGVTFIAPFVDAGGQQPKLKKFKLTFNNSITNVFDNLKIYRTVNPVYSPATAVDVTNEGAILSVNSSTLDVDLTANPTDLSLGNMSFFLVVNVNPLVNGTTPPVQVSMIDNGFGTSTDSNILTTKGSSSSSLFSFMYTFDPTIPPTLTSSLPHLGQSNFPVTQQIVELEFDAAVMSLDGKINLIDVQTQQAITLTAINGQIGLGIPVNPLQFAIPPGALVPDHTYYISVDPGNFPASTGITDEFGNLFGGILPGSLFFRTSSVIPPALLGIPSGAPSDPFISNITSSSAVIHAIFDRPGTAYYLIVPAGSVAPVNAQIRGTLPYPETVLARGSVSIKQTNTVLQTGVVTFLSPLPPFSLFDVWMFAENDALPAPVSTTAPYGPASVNFAVDGSQRTFNFISPPPSGTTTINSPTISICGNSYQIMNSPILISEGEIDQAFAGVGSQFLEMELSPGYEFDISTTSGIPDYGTVALIGSDFAVGSGSLNFLSSTKLRVGFTSTGNTSVDAIAISSLRIKASITTSGSITRSGGSALPGIALGTTMAIINPFAPNSVSFTNSYTIANAQAGAPPITTIPDNAVPKIIGLIPTTASGGSLFGMGDFGPSVFDGQGISANALNISSVPVDTPFSIHLTHTDNNGCVSESTMQYEIFSHSLVITSIPASVCAKNDQFPGAAPFDVATHDISFDNVSGYYQIGLTSDIPTTASPQLISGPAWQTLVQTLAARGSSHDPAGNPVPGQLYYDYKVDDAVILNASMLSGGLIANPYNNFIGTTPLGKTYYSGGSLGIVEFTGHYQKISNASQQITRKKQLEFFVPALPVVEIASGMPDATDPLNVPTAGNPGTLVFCELSGNVLINGYPAAVPGTSTGTFTFTDAQTNVVISQVAASLTGYVDNGNGTAWLDPLVINNTYRDIRITYTFKTNNSPCSSSFSQVIRIVPNPAAAFTVTSVAGPHIVSPAAACAGEAMNFSSSPSSIPSGSTITAYAWDFGDGGTSSNASAPHTYLLPGTYTPTMVATSNWGCVSSVARINTFVVGQVPSPDFNVNGALTTDLFSFINHTAASPTIDPIVGFTWDFGDGTTAATLALAVPAAHSYANAGSYTAKITAFTSMGCMNTLSKSVIVQADPASSPAVSPPSSAPGAVAPDPNPTSSGVVTAINSDDFETASAEGNKIVIGNSYPNPFRETTTIPLFLPKSNQSYSISIVLYDMTGRQLSAIRNESMSTGLHQMRLDRAAITENLSSGLYLFKTTITNNTNHFVVTQKVIVE